MHHTGDVGSNVLVSLPGRAKFILLLSIPLILAGWLVSSQLSSRDPLVSGTSELSLSPCEPDMVPNDGLQITTDSETGQVVLSGAGSWYTVIAGGDIGAYSLHVYDSAGRHTGPNRKLDVVSEFLAVESKIPNSSFERLGGKYYVTLDAQDEYYVELRGEGTGKFDLKITKGLSGDDKAPVFRYPGSVVNSSLRASVVLRCGLNPPPDLVIDSDGDRRPELRQKPYSTSSQPRDK